MNTTPQRIAFKVNAKAERMIRKEHPWVFDQAIVKQSKAGAAGDLAIIYDQKSNKLLAIGLYDPYSPIRIKVLQFKQSAVINDEWFGAKIEAAFAQRQPLFQTDTNSYRLIYGENDGLPALIVDVYADVLVIKLYSTIWLPYLEKITALLMAVGQAKTVVLRLSRNVQKLKTDYQDGQILAGELEDENVIFREHGLRFVANVLKGHKTGYFLDHRHNRKRVGELAKGKRVLDVFSYAGGFSVHALAGGATSVLSVDISAQALELAKKNVRLNELEAKHETLAKDAFEAMKALANARQKFDLIIIDPPAFAKRESEVAGAIHSYKRLVKAILPLLAPNAILLMASCSSRVKADVFFEAVLEVIRSSGRSSQELERTFHDVDHPIGFAEGAYLKSVYLVFF